MKIFTLIVFVLTLVSAAAQEAAPLKVVALHPLIADLAANVGGDHVQVVSLMTANDDPHHFTPTPTALHRAKGAKIYLASGMGMETYLAKLRDTLGGGATLLEVGKSIPARKVHAHHHGHDHGDEECQHEGDSDPHWWHNISHMQRAADAVAKAFAAADPVHAADYQKNARSYRTELAKLEGWVKRELIRIPRADRKLVTAHDSLGYFCDAYGFEAVSVKGINKSSEPSAKDLATVIKTIRSQNIKAIFPEQRANPKALQALSQETGVRIGGQLIADGSTSYISMMKHNVNTITAALITTP